VIVGDDAGGNDNTMIDAETIRDRFRSYRASERAVSPVIGVILMVAITVILAAVIGAFVLQLNQNEDTAPQSSINADQERTVVWGVGSPGSPGDSSPVNYGQQDEVILRHKGGDAMQRQDIQIRAEVTRNGSDIQGYGIGYQNVTQNGANTTVPTNLTQPLWNDIEKQKIRTPAQVSVNHYITENLDSNDAGEEIIDGDQQCSFGNESGTGDSVIIADNDTPSGAACEIAYDDANYWDREDQNGWLDSDDTIRVVWTPPDSSKTQVLRTYDVA
jgi:flagellin-like protein